MFTIQERKKFRDELIIDLYKKYFETGGEPLKLSKGDLAKEREKDLAYKYLDDKGLIIVKTQGVQTIFITISASGIDLVENNFPEEIIN